MVARTLKKWGHLNFVKKTIVEAGKIPTLLTKQAVQPTRQNQINAFINIKDYYSFAGNSSAD